MMIFRTVLFLLLIFPVVTAFTGTRPQPIDQADVYTAMAATTVKELDEALAAIEKTTLEGKLAYEGALLMKKSGLLKAPGQKLKVFKLGREKLEGAIRKDSGNIEYRFLRLMIQENVPKIVGYKKDIDVDSTLVVNAYKTLSPVLRRAIKDYSKTSKILKTADL
jgi:hypothetical protein